jgi:hypothetical protein
MGSRPCEVSLLYIDSAGRLRGGRPASVLSRMWLPYAGGAIGSRPWILLHTNSVGTSTHVSALRGQRQGATAPPAPPARGAAPGNPDSMPAYVQRLAYMPAGRLGRQQRMNDLAQRRHVPVL